MQIEDEAMANSEEMNEAREMITTGNADGFLKLMTKVDTATHEYERHVGLLEKEEYTNYTVTDTKVTPVFTQDQKESLLADAMNADKLEILKVLSDQGISLPIDTIKDLMGMDKNKSREKQVILQSLMQPVLENAVRVELFKDNVSWDDKIKSIEKEFENSGFPSGRKRIEAIKSFVEQHSEIKKLACQEKDPSHNDGRLLQSGKNLNTFNAGIRQEIAKFITGSMNGNDLCTSGENLANRSIGMLEENSSGWKILKNFLLFLTVIGPPIKWAFTDQAWFDNITTDKVKDMKSNFSEMKKTLKNFKTQEHDASVTEVKISGSIPKQ